MPPAWQVDSRRGFRTWSPEFDSSRRFWQVGLNEINNLAAIFSFSCGGTFVEKYSYLHL